MNASRTFVALVAGHTLVASMAWMTGYLTGRLMERRAREVIDLCDRVQGDVDEFIRLLTPPAAPYDWAARLDSGVGDPPDSWPAVITLTAPNKGVS